MLGFVWDFSARGRTGITGLCCALSALFAVAAHADQITAKGDTLNGKLVSMGDAGLVFETAYAKDKLAIKYEDITDIRTDGPVQVLHGEHGETIGRLHGIENGKLLVGADATSATAVDITTITLGTPTEGQAWGDRMRSRFRYWHGSFDFGFGLTRSRIDDTTLLLGLSLTRKKAPTRFFLDIYGTYGKQETDELNVSADGTRVEESTTETRSQDSLRGRVRGEYDLTKQFYVFGSGDALYDGIQQLSIRAVPKAGAGYRIWETKTDIFQVEAGGAYVYEKYFGGDTNDFFAVAFGSFLDTGLWYGSRFTWRMDYLPSVADWIGDYLVRNELALIVPIFAPFNLKLTFLDEYDSTPAHKDFDLMRGGMLVTENRKTADNNRLTFTVGLSVAF